MGIHWFRQTPGVERYFAIQLDGSQYLPVIPTTFFGQYPKGGIGASQLEKSRIPHSRVSGAVNEADSLSQPSICVNQSEILSTKISQDIMAGRGW